MGELEQRISYGREKHDAEWAGRAGRAVGTAWG